MVLVDPAKGDAKVVYLGDDAAKAERAFEKAAADKANECVRMFIYPAHARIQYPADNADHLERQAEVVRDAETAAANAKLAKLQADADKAQKALDAHKTSTGQATAPEVETPAPEKAKKPKAKPEPEAADEATAPEVDAAQESEQTK